MEAPVQDFLLSFEIDHAFTGLKIFWKRAFTSKLNTNVLGKVMYYSDRQF